MAADHTQENLTAVTAIMSSVNRSETIHGIQMSIRFTGINMIGQKYAVVCQYPKNDFVKVAGSGTAANVTTRFDVNEYHEALESQRVREFDTVIFDATIEHDRYGVVNASGIKITECIRNSPI
jgi:hypothetical protein